MTNSDSSNKIYYDKSSNSQVMVSKNHLSSKDFITNNNMNNINSIVSTILKKYTNEKDSVEEIIHALRSYQKEQAGDNNEPLLDESSRKFTVFPIKYNDIWQAYKQQQAMFWKAEEVDFSKDKDDYKTLKEGEKTFVKFILAFFAASDGIVNFNLSERFLAEITNMEALINYQFQMMMENIHGEIYSQMLDNIIVDRKEREYLFNAIQNIESVKKMADWAFKWIESSKSFGTRVIAFAIVEGVFFSGAFAAIFWFKKTKAKGKDFMNGLTSSNDFIARDEARHVQNAVLMYSKVQNKVDASEVHQMFKEAVEIAQNFYTDALPVSLLGMNSTLMNQYIRYTADRLISDLGYKKIYNDSNPFPFMNTIGLDSKKNLHERRPNEYQDAYVLNTEKTGDYFGDDDDDDDDEW